MLPLRAHIAFCAAYVAARSQPALLQPFHRLHTSGTKVASPSFQVQAPSLTPSCKGKSRSSAHCRVRAAPLPVSEVAATSKLPHTPAQEQKMKHTLCVLLVLYALYRSVRSQLPASFSTSTCRVNQSQHTRIMRVVRVMPYRSVKSRLPAQLCLGLKPFTPRRAICVQDSSDVSFSASSIYRRFSTAY
jgi:hypothetical protein